MTSFPRAAASSFFASGARTRIALCYLWRHGRLPDLDCPLRFTELVQLRKLADRSPLLPLRVDKLTAKQLARDVLGKDWIVPTLWEGNAIPAPDAFTVPVIVKARHGCNQFSVVERRPDASDHARLVRKARHWQARPYGEWLDEWAYRDVPRGVMAEPLLGAQLPLPVDYKVYVFGGRATHMQVHLQRGVRHRWLLFDRAWRPLVQYADRLAPPQSIEAMFAAAEALSADTSFMRVDFYEVAGVPLFGEFCVYPGSGLDPFPADWIDFELGALWHEALGNTSFATALPDAPVAFPA